VKDSLDPARWEKVIALYHAASEHEPAQRSTFLVNACEGDNVLRSEVESLLRQDVSEGDMLERIAGENRNWSPAAKLDSRPMTLSAGTRLAHYEILGLLGAGGMGEVYRARDLKLKREVAIKILPEELSRDADRVSRFQREAEVLASLNHANIAIIHDVLEANETRFLVLELVEGETLGERIQRGPIPVDEALEIGRHICEALEAAHERGIIHRDLKPANVKITPDGKVKVLDFGLSKAVTQSASPTGRSHQGVETDPVAATVSNSPTLMSGSDAVILGTVPYMSPEQARGQPVDQRTDVFSFGCVLYEMLTAQQAFQGEDISEILGAVTKKNPDLSLLPADLNVRLYELLRRCFAKNRKDRWQAIGDVRIEIAGLMLDPRAHQLPPLHKSRSRVFATWAVSAAVIAVMTAAITTWIVWSLRPAATTLVTRFSYVLPEEQRFTRAGRHLVALSPDGKKVVYVADGQLYLKSLDEMIANPIPGTSEDVDTPFFSPDSMWVAFHSVSQRKLKKVAVSGGASVTICDLYALPFGASWTADGNILLGAGASGIQRVSAGGGTLETLVKVEPNQVGQSPQLLPDGHTVLFTIAANTGNDRWDKAQIVTHSLKTGERKTIMKGGGDARYVSTGHIVYAVGNILFAVPFDPSELQVTGRPVSVVQGVLRLNPADSGAANYSFSDNGSLVFVQNDRFGDQRSLVLIDLNGKRRPLDLRPASYLTPRFSPNGKQFAAVVNDEREGLSIWIHDLAGVAAPRRLNFGGSSALPLWTPDGRYIVFRSEPKTGPPGIFRQLSDGNGAAERLTAAEMDEDHRPESWSPDGKLLTLSIDSPRGRGVWALSLDGDRKLKPVFLGNSIQSSSSLSPDGRWLAYASAETDSRDIFVQPFSGGEPRYQITVSTLQTMDPLWSSDGKQLFYLENQIGGGRPRIFSVDIQAQPGLTLTYGQPKPLPIEGMRLGGVQYAGRPYDISPDGKQFIATYSRAEVQPGGREAYQMNFVLNWFTELQQRASVK